MVPVKRCLLVLAGLTLLAGCGSTLAAGSKAVHRIRWQWPHKDLTRDPVWNTYTEQLRILPAQDPRTGADDALRIRFAPGGLFRLHTVTGPGIYPGVGYQPFRAPSVGVPCSYRHRDGWRSTWCMPTAAGGTAPHAEPGAGAPLSRRGDRPR